MIRRICPICDQMMKSAHYCSNCKAFVKNPYIRNTDYYLNERHPADAHDCTYHDDRWNEMQSQDISAQSGRAVSGQRGRTASGQRQGTYGQSSGTASGQWRELSGQIGRAAGSFTQSESGTSGRTGKARSSRGKNNSVIILVVVLIFMAVEFALPILFQLIRMMRWWF